jgi:hypothetical protein
MVAARGVQCGESSFVVATAKSRTDLSDYKTRQVPLFSPGSGLRQLKLYSFVDVASWACNAFPLASWASPCYVSRSVAVRLHAVARNIVQICVRFHVAFGLNVHVFVHVLSFGHFHHSRTL